MRIKLSSSVLSFLLSVGLSTVLVGGQTVDPNQHTVARSPNSDGSTKQRIRELTYQVQELRREPIFAELVSSDVFVRHGPGFKSKKLFEGGQEPSLSPDGAKVAFLLFPYRSRGSRAASLVKYRQIRLMNTDGSGQKALTHLPFGVNYFAWSPVEMEIAYFENRKLDGHAKLVVVNANTGERRELTEFLDLRCGRGSLFSWSPDGRKIAFTSCSDGKQVVVTVGSNGGNTTTVIHGYGPVWSPDGERILFRHISDSKPPTPSTWIVNADGSEPRIVLDKEGAAFGAAWSPDGKSIAFGSERDSKHHSEIFRINVDGTGLGKIVTYGDRHFWQPSFSPDGTRLVVNSGMRDDFAVWMVDLASRRIERLTNGNYGSILWDN